MKPSALALVFCLAATWSTASLAITDSERLASIAEHYFDQKVILDPLEGSETTGEARFEGKFEITIAPENIYKRKVLLKNTLDQLKKIDSKSLSSADLLTYHALKAKLESTQEVGKFPEQLMPLDQMYSIPVYFAQLGSGQSVQALKTPADYDNYLARLDKLPAWIDQAILNMQAGIKRHVVLPKSLAVSALPAHKALANTDLAKNPFYTAINNLPASFSEQDKTRITAAYQVAIRERLIPAATKLVNFLEKDYLPKGRTTAGIDALPKGKEWYEALVKFHTTTNLSPAEIHEIGLQEVARIQGEMEKIKTHYQFTGSLREFLQWHSSNKEFRPFTTEQQVLDSYTALNNKIAEKLPSLFGRAPKVPLIVLPEPEITRDTASDHYIPPAADGSRPGIYYAVITDPTTYSNTTMTSLLLHEGQPGHHFHIGLQQEMDLPKFRKYGWISAYGEGWALYAETLGKEMGFYEDPNQYLGHLKLELTRAVRLVTDTGLHAKGWTQEQTMNYMIEVEAKSPESARQATERYMSWPGQALAYKVGALKIQALRAKAQTQLGTKFSLSAFHDLVLSDGVLPLSLLEEKVDGWIKAQL